MSLPEIGAGDVDIVLNGTTKILKPSYGAALKLSRYNGGLVALQHQIMALDIEAITMTIAAGLGVENDEKFAQAVYENGLYTLYAPAGLFVSNVSNGGRPLPPPVAADPKAKKRPQQKA